MKNHKRLLSAAIVLILAASSAFQYPDTEGGKKTISETFTVNGACGMCETRIEETVMFLKGVKLAEWSKEDQELTVVFNSKKITLQEIQQAIANAGHDAGSIKASDSAYSKLPGCCRYRDIEVH